MNDWLKFTVVLTGVAGGLYVIYTFANTLANPCTNCNSPCGRVMCPLQAALTQCYQQLEDYIHGQIVAGQPINQTYVDTQKAVCAQIYQQLLNAGLQFSLQNFLITIAQLAAAAVVIVLIAKYGIAAVQRWRANKQYRNPETSDGLFDWMLDGEFNMAAVTGLISSASSVGYRQQYQIFTNNAINANASTLLINYVQQGILDAVSAQAQASFDATAMNTDLGVTLAFFP